MPSRPGTAGRALLAAALTAGFHLLALGLVVALVWTPSAAIRQQIRQDPRLLLAATAAAVLVLWVAFPRRDRFASPGPALSEREQPRLFAELRAAAAAAGHPLPPAIHLVNDANARAGERGGRLGLGARRVLALGWPLLEALSVAELRALVARECGRGREGQGGLARWALRARGAHERALQDRQGAFLRGPFQAYARLFVRLTGPVARANEQAVDALAARVAGPAAATAARQREQLAAREFPTFWVADVKPVLAAGRRPPLLAGFARHLGRRLAEESAAPDASARASSLLDDVDALERRLLAAAVGEREAAALTPLAWEDAGRDVHVPRWRAAVAEHARALRGLRAADLPACARDLRPFLVKFMPETANPDHLEYESLSRYADQVVTAAVAVAMHRAGATVDCLPGEAMVLRRGDATFAWSSVLLELAQGGLSEADWLATADRFGIRRLDLGETRGRA